MAASAQRFSLRQRLGACVYDLPRFIWAMRPSTRHPWVLMRNRDECLVGDGQRLGALCKWQWTSDLHIAKVFPSLGRALMKRATRDRPVEFQSEPSRNETTTDVSFVIGQRGVQRLPHLLLTIKSIAAQRDASLECVVVEQSAKPEVKDALPSWVRYVHTPLPYPEMPYCRSWAFNVGARAARGRVLVLHDNDMLVPNGYCQEILARYRDGYEVMNLKRFIFFLAEDHTRRVLSNNGSLVDEAPESIMQNSEGGGSIAITRDAYFSIGGFDESFVGWGGEDNEFWQRAQTRRVWLYGYLPLVHLWHPPQRGKLEKTRSTAPLLEARSAIPPAERIAQLTARDFGNHQFSPVKLSPVGPSLLGA